MAKENLFSEIMVAPTLPVGLGEWFEVQNPGNRKLNLRDCVFEDDAGANFIVDVDRIIEPGGYNTFAISANHAFVPDFFTIVPG